MTFDQAVKFMAEHKGFAIRREGWFGAQPFDIRPRDLEAHDWMVGVVMDVGGTHFWTRNMSDAKKLARGFK